MSKRNPQVGDSFFIADKPDRVLTIIHKIGDQCWMQDAKGTGNAIVTVSDLQDWAFQRPVRLQRVLELEEVTPDQWRISNGTHAITGLSPRDLEELAWRVLYREDPHMGDVRRGIEAVRDEQ